MSNTQTRISVPVAEVALEVYRAVFLRLGLLLDLAWLPLLIMLAVTLLPGYLQLYRGWNGLPVWSAEGVTLHPEDIATALISILCLNAFAVRWHQVMLFTRESPVLAGTFWRAWGWFLLYALLIYLVSAAALMLLLFSAAGGVTSLLPAAAVVAALVWLGVVRCSLLFPAAAFGQPLGIFAAWRQMSGNFWRLFACGIVVCLPVILSVALLLSGIFAGFHMERFGPAQPLGFFILRGVVSICTNVIIVALGASVLSSFYRRIVLQQP
jgi:hypothetical protein